MKTFSIIIPALNAATTLDDCLRCVDTLAFPKSHKEIIVVDGGSTDTSIDIAKKWGAQVIEGSYSRPAAARNIGAAAAKHDHLVFIDADYRVPGELLGHAVEKLLFFDLFGTWLAPCSDHNWIAKTWLSAKKPEAGMLHSLSAGVLIVSKAHFQKIGGFNADYRADAFREFCLHAHSMGLNLYHDVSVPSIDMGQPQSLRRFFDREMRHAASKMQLFRDYGVVESSETVALYFGVFLSCLALVIGILGMNVMVFAGLLGLWLMAALLWTALHITTPKPGQPARRRGDHFLNLTFLYLVSLVAKSAALFRYHQVDDLLRPEKF